MFLKNDIFSGFFGIFLVFWCFYDDKNAWNNIVFVKNKNSGHFHQKINFSRGLDFPHVFGIIHVDVSIE